MKNNTVLTTASVADNNFATVLERKQGQRLTVATTISITANVLFLVVAGFGMNQRANGEILPPHPFMPGVVIEVVQNPAIPAAPKTAPVAETTPIRLPKMPSPIAVRETREITRPVTPTIKTQKTIASNDTGASSAPETAAPADMPEAQAEPITEETPSIADASPAGGADATFANEITASPATGTAPTMRGAAGVANGGAGIVGAARESVSGTDFGAGISFAPGTRPGSGGGQPGLGTFKGGNIVASGTAGMGETGGVSGAGLAGTGGVSIRATGTGTGTGDQGGVGNGMRGGKGIGDGIGDSAGRPVSKIGGNNGAPVGRGEGSGVKPGNGYGSGEFGIGGGAGKGADIGRTETKIERGTVKIEARETKSVEIKSQPVRQIDNNTNPVQVNADPVKTPEHPVSRPDADTTLSSKIDAGNFVALTEARILAKAKPVITEDAKATNPRAVRVAFTVSANGSVTYKMLGTSGNADVDAAVLAACARYKWAAATRGAKAVTSVQTITFDPNE